MNDCKHQWKKHVMLIIHVLVRKINKTVTTLSMNIVYIVHVQNLKHAHM